MSHSTKSSRREFIGAASAAIGMSVLGDQSPTFGQTGTQPSAPKVRRNIFSLAENDPILVNFDLAVKRLKAPDAKAKYGITWQELATIHANHCAHENWHFLSWHRAYLLYFEAICRRVSGYQYFMLPYWDWTRNDKIHPAFLQGSLNHPRSFSGVDDAVKISTKKSAVTIAMSKPDFEKFGGVPSKEHRSRISRLAESIENPHNIIHGDIGGDMNDPALAARDPIFWIHHANVDRLWCSWNQTYSNPTKTDWLDYDKYTFINPQSNRVYTPREINDTRKNGYYYENLESRPMLTTAPQTIGSDLLTGLRAAAPMGPAGVAIAAAGTGILEASFNLAGGQQKKLTNSSTPAGQPPDRLLLLMDGVRIKQGVACRLFLNCPYLSPKTEIDSQHYVNTFALFTHHHADNDAHSHGTQVVMDITEIVARLGISNLQTLKPQLVPRRTESDLVVANMRLLLT